MGEESHPQPSNDSKTPAGPPGHAKTTRGNRRNDSTVNRLPDVGIGTGQRLIDGVTEYHAAYFAHELTRRAATDDPDKLANSLLNSGIDLNPHQIDAALFAFKSPLSRGAILADEVGLGKTIEAGLIISQLWAERKRRILIICPTMIRKQWAQELAEKFSIDALILDRKAYNFAKKQDREPFAPNDQVVICSYHFASAQQLDVFKLHWDLVVIDEAHRLRNVWKNPSGIAAKIQNAVENRPLVLLTATPLQNTLLELYGLVSYIDPHMFGNINAFRARYMSGPIQGRELGDLRARLKPICQRTLRRQVPEIRFTHRLPLTHPFEPNEDEQRLYNLVSAYLQRENIVAIPYRQRSLLILIVRKILASSSFAIANTLQSLIDRLRTEGGDALERLEEDVDSAEETADEWSEAESDTENLIARSPEDIRKEIAELSEYLELAKSITKNAKGEALLQALDKGFEKMHELGGNRKAVVFTESKRTQRYLADLLSANGYAGRIVTLSGSGSDENSNRIYREWLQRHKGSPNVTGSKPVDFRSALVEEFRDRADILISTEAGAEGLNLQFCSLVVNYDLPWNPQRVEQRIGRCHRYGQRHDVVVVNFLNQKNAADLRVYELLSEKFKLFEGVFGASDQILGALESGVDFEKRILQIYQTCRTKDEIDTAFDALKAELEEQIEQRMTEASRKLLEDFDEEVRERIRATGQHALTRLDSVSRMLWQLAKHELGDSARFCDDDFEFEYESERYRVARPGVHLDGVIRFSPGSPLGERLIAQAASRALESAHVVFDYTNTQEKAGILVPYLGRSGWLMLSVLSVESEQDREDRLLFSVLDDGGEPLESDFGAKLFTQRAKSVSPTLVPPDVETALSNRAEYLKNLALEDIAQKNRRFFEQELEKLELWADDLKHGLEFEIKQLDREIKDVAREAKLAPTLDEKVALEKKRRELESKRNHKRRQLFEEQDKIDAEKEALIQAVEGRLRQAAAGRPVLTLKWEVT